VSLCEHISRTTRPNCVCLLAMAVAQSFCGAPVATCYVLPVCGRRHRITPLLRGIGCALSYSTAGAISGRFHRKGVSGAKSAVHHRLAFLNQTSPAFVHCYNMSLYLQLACKRLSWQHSDYDGKIYRVAQNKIPHWRICNISANGGLILKILGAT